MIDEIKTKDFQQLNLKRWQVDAYLYTLFYCCLEIRDLFRRGWNLSRICSMYVMFGDIFDIEIVNFYYKNFNISTIDDFHKEFTTNLRLVPKEYHNELYNHCILILEKGDTKSDAELREILKQELMEI